LVWVGVGLEIVAQPAKRAGVGRANGSRL